MSSSEDREFIEELNKNRTSDLTKEYIYGALRQKQGAERFKELSAGPVDAQFLKDYKYILCHAPHEVQMAFHQGPNFVRAFYGGQRSGKTLAGVVEMVWIALGMHPYIKRFNLKYTPNCVPARIRSISTDIKRSFWNILWPYYSLFLGEVGGLNIATFSRERMQMVFRNGSTIEFMSNEQHVRMFFGVSLDAAHFDEEPYEPVYEENLRRLVDRDGRAIMTFTPDKTLGYYTWSFDKIKNNIKRNKDEFIYWRQQGLSKKEAWNKATPLVGIWDCPTERNPYIDHHARRKVEQLTGDKLSGDYMVKSAFVFPEFGEHNLRISLQDKPPNIFWEELMVIVGIDHQESMHNPQGVVFCGVDRYQRVWVLDEIFEPGLIEHTANLIHKKLQGAKPAYVVLDTNAKVESSVSGISAKQEYGKHKLFCVDATKDKGQAIRQLKKMFKGPEPTLFILKPNCPNLIRQLRQYVWDPHLSAKMGDRRNPKETPMKKNDHLIDALMYVLTYGHGPRYRPPAERQSTPHQPNKEKKPTFSKTGY